MLSYREPFCSCGNTTRIINDSDCSQGNFSPECRWCPLNQALIFSKRKSYQETQNDRIYCRNVPLPPRFSFNLSRNRRQRPPFISLLSLHFYLKRLQKPYINLTHVLFDHIWNLLNDVGGNKPNLPLLLSHPVTGLTMKVNSGDT